MFTKKEQVPEITVVSKNSYKIVEHQIVDADDKFYNVVAVVGNDGKLRSIELNCCTVEDNVIDFKGAYVEEIKYSNNAYTQRIYTR